MYKLLVLSVLFCVYCTALPAIENGDSDKVLSDPLPTNTDTILSDPLPTPVDEHEHGGDLDSFFEVKAVNPEGEQTPVAEAASESAGERARRSPAEEEKKNEGESDCVVKGQKGICVKYYLCADDSKQDKLTGTVASTIPDKECESYVDTCCLQLQTDIVQVIDLQ